MQKNLVKNDNELTHEESLKEILEHTLEISKNQSLKVSELFNHLGSKGFGVVLVFLSLPSALPVPAPGYSTPFGIAIALIAFQILIGRSVLETPKSIEKIEFQPKLLQFPKQLIYHLQHQLLTLFSPPINSSSLLQIYPKYLPIAKDAFVPPNPKLFDNTVSSSIFSTNFVAISLPLSSGSRLATFALPAIKLFSIISIE